jgi:serine/threonine protein kinase
MSKITINNNKIELIEDYPEEIGTSTQEASVTYNRSGPKQINYDELDHAYNLDFYFFRQTNPYLLGSGTFANVYKTKLDNIDVALKIYKLKPSMAFNASYDHEKREHEKLNHPNIIQLIGYVETTSGFRALVLEVAQMSLQNYLDTNKNVQRDPTICKQYAKDIIKGLVYLHALAKIHRDLNPENILIVNNTAKISDFGCSGDLFTATSGNTFLVVRNQAEQIECFQPETFANDIYSLSIILYLLTTKNKSVLVGNPRVPTTAPVQWQYLIHRGLNVKPGHRPLIKEFVDAVNDPNLKFRPQ